MDDAMVVARITRREVTEDGRGVRIEWRCGACGAIGTPQDSMFRFHPRECDRCGAVNKLEAARDDR